ncbi:hypothetical protein [Burkholderia cepacia]|uniref:hypothetical protein n=1 Tax=Burkholderia cepacia TaxID=292 RepID=UPI002AB0514F|nr:hypothetical protein [Burkholderia cepacia]
MSSFDDAFDASAALRHPLAISGGEMSVFVEPLEDRSSRLFTHIGEEILERIKPSVTHANPASAVRAEPGIVRIGAAILGMGPRAICARSLATRHRLAMFAARISELFVVKATARRGPARGQLRCAHKCLFSALTSAFPSNDGAAVGIECAFPALHDSESPKFHIRQISKGAHDVRL